jgi:response regulator RpfG family c-di-GMP phosphodiesterase
VDEVEKKEEEKLAQEREKFAAQNQGKALEQTIEELTTRLGNIDEEERLTMARIQEFEVRKSVLVLQECNTSVLVMCVCMCSCVYDVGACVQG